jgi:hypothetical protein
MDNPFRTSRQNLQVLFSEPIRRFTAENFDRLLETYTRSEIERQIASGIGPIIDQVGAHTAVQAANNSNVEIMTALSLSDFYWPHSETEIAFELRRNVVPASITSYERLIAGIENNTHIDCQITADNVARSFQIKRYPFSRLGNTNASFLRWLNESVIQRYGNMAGTILVVILQPDGTPEQTPLNPGELATSLAGMTDQITFDEVALTYNDRGQYFVLHKLYPEHRRLLVPLDLGLRRLRGEA